MGESELTQQDIDALLTKVHGGEGEALPAGATEAMAMGLTPPLLEEPAFEAFEAADDLGPAAAETLDALLDVTLDVSLELGRTTLRVEDILRLNEGAVVELEQVVDEPVQILVNDVPVARGEVVVLNDNFGVRITEILEPEARLDAAEGEGESG